MPYELRPLSLAELLDRAFGMYRRHFLLFVGIMAIPSVVMLVFSVAIQFIQAPVAPPDPAAAPDPAQMIGAAIWGGAVFVLMMILYWLTYAVALGASTTAVAELYKGEVPSIAASYGFISGKVGRLALLMLLVGLRIGGGMLLVGMIIAVLVPGLLRVSPIIAWVFGFAALGAGVVFLIWLMLRYAVAVPPAVLEDSTASESIARSIELTGGSRWRVLVIMVFTVIIAYAGLMLFQGPFIVASVMAGPETATGFWLNLLGVITGSIASALTNPLAIVAMAVLYYDLRIRHEGLDIELMIEALPAKPSSPAVLPG